MANPSTSTSVSSSASDFEVDVPPECKSHKRKRGKRGGLRGRIRKHRPPHAHNNFLSSSSEDDMDEMEFKRYIGYDGWEDIYQCKMIRKRYEGCRISCTIDRANCECVRISLTSQTGAVQYKVNHKPFRYFEKEDLGPYIQKWQELKDDGEQARRLRVFIDALDKVSASMTFADDIWSDDNEREFHEKGSGDARQRPVVQYPYTVGSRLSRELATKRNLAWQDMMQKIGLHLGKTDINKIEEEIEECFEYVGKLHETHQIENILKIELMNALSKGLVNSMHNSHGRQLVEKLLKAAAYVCYGDAFSSKIRTENVTSKYHHHAFPVQSAATSSAGSPILSTSSSSKKRPKLTAEDKAMNVHPDFLLFAKKREPVFIFVAEVKSEPTLGDFEEQILKEIAGAAMHQSDVFGLLMNASQARICRFSVNKVTKVIDMNSSVFSGAFVYSDIEKRSDALALFFKTLVAIVEFGAEKVHLLN